MKHLPSHMLSPVQYSICLPVEVSSSFIIANLKEEDEGESSAYEHLEPAQCLCLHFITE